jgi:hypothetical protein
MRESSRASNIQCSATFSYTLFTHGSLACAARCLASSAFRRQSTLSDDIGESSLGYVFSGPAGGSSFDEGQRPSHGPRAIAVFMMMPPGLIEDRRAVARERHGLFRCGTFAAARVRRPSIQNIRERYSDHVPPGPNTWTLNIQPLDQFRPHRGRSTLSNTVACLLHTAR